MMADFHVGDKVFSEFDEAAGHAVALAVSGKTVELDVVIYSEEDARSFGGDDAVERYREDPDAIFERIEVRATSLGRGP